MKKFYFIALAAAALLTACDKTPSGTETDGGSIMISPLLTRVSDLNFDEGDRIGLTIIKGGDETFVENAPMTYSENVFSGNLTWYSDAEVTSDFIAYYPYNPAGAPTTFSIQTDQSEGVSQSDFILGTETGITPTESAVGMTFRHKFTKIVVNMTNTTGSNITSVIFSGSKITADVDFAEAAVSVSTQSETADVTACETEDDQTYAVIIVPQEVALTIKVTTADGTEYEKELENTEYVQGGQYTVTAQISDASGIQISVEGEIVDWTDEGEIGPGGGDEPGGENTIEYGGVTYKTVTLSNGQTWMAEPLRYVPDGMTVSSDPADPESHIWYPYKDNGGTSIADTDEGTIAAKGYLYDMCAALGGIEVTEENCQTFEGAQGICPDGWHIPTWQDYFELCGKSSPAYGDNPTVKNDALFYDVEYDGAKVSSFNESGWNFVFTGSRMKTNFTATGSYPTQWLDDSNCSVEAYWGNPRTTNLMTSSSKGPSAAGTSIVFMTVMTTFTNSYLEGRVTLSQAQSETGQQLRCIKDAE